MFSAPKTLPDLRLKWITRTAFELAHGSTVRESFREQLGRFFDALTRAVETGDPGWMDSVLLEWTGAPTLTDLQQGKNPITDMFQVMGNSTIAMVRESLPAETALDLMPGITQVFMYLVKKSSRMETDTQLTYISRELTSTQQKLEKLNLSKSNFVSIAAHELKTPLTLIEGYTAMLEDTSPAVLDEIHPLLQGMTQGIGRLRGIVDDLIDVSLIENNDLSMHFQPIWLNRIFAMLADELQETLKSRQQTLVVKEFDGIAIPLQADGARLMQAFRNLVFNAIKYTPDGGCITIDGRTLPGFVEITVTDTGIGINVEDEDEIFEKFGQLGKVELHSTGKSKFKGGGAGLGLPIVKGIIEAHQGTIWVESDGHDEERMPGSTFHIMLPIRERPVDPRLSSLEKSMARLTQ